MILKKEFILIVVILSLIIFLEILTNNITKDYINSALNQLEKIQQKVEMLIKNDKENAELDDLISEIKLDWENKQNVLALFIPHVKLEKINEIIIYLQTNIQNLEYKQALENINEIKYILEKFNENDDVLLKNIF